ncbi:MAG: ASCH domain-containing protein [Alphaproteobacteria bacterium]|nr:ASCH domain-containing protein [Alphaproteobacteria bacterium]
MLIVNINGPINSGKTTVSKILEKKMQNAVFIEGDGLISDEEKKRLGLSESWVFFQNKLEEKLEDYKASKKYETIIFAYPIGEKNYKRWKALADNQTCFLNITLAPSLEVCLTNRGTRQLDDWEKNRIKEMYEEGYQKRTYSDFVLNNETQTPEETAEIIKGFVGHALSSRQQWVHLVERRWPALVSGEKTATLRLNEGFIHKGFLVYKDYPKEQWAEVVYVTEVYYQPLKQALEIEGFDEHTPNVETGLKQMQAHYPDITLETPLLLAKHLSVPETLSQYPKEVQHILESIK